MTTLVDIPIKKGSVAAADSIHIRGSIDAISKIKYFKIEIAKIQKKVNETTRQHDNEFLINTC